MKLIISCIICLVPFFLDAQIITTYSGNGMPGITGDGGPATAATLTNPHSLTFDKFGNLYYCDFLGCVVRKVSPTGIITTIAGTGLAGFFGDGGPATAALLKYPDGVTCDSLGNVYISDHQNFRIRKVDINTGLITTIAGTGVGSSTGDGGLASAATFFPSEIHLDKRGNLYIADGYNNNIRKINTAGIISTYGGIGTSGFSGDGGPATAAQFWNPLALNSDSKDNLFIADHANKRVRKIDTFGVISTVAGVGVAVYVGDGMPATSAQVGTLFIGIDKHDRLYLSDSSNRIRMIDNTGIIHTVAGTGVMGFNGDNIPATMAQFNGLGGIAFDSCDNMYFSDVLNYRIRKITYHPAPCKFLESSVANPIKISIYPNPSNDILHIDNLQTTADYRLLSMVGAVLQQGGLKEGSNVIDITALPVGMYLVEVTNAAVGWRMMYKIVKQ